MPRSKVEEMILASTKERKLLIFLTGSTLTDVNLCHNAIEEDLLDMIEEIEDCVIFGGKSKWVAFDRDDGNVCLYSSAINWIILNANLSKVMEAYSGDFYYFKNKELHLSCLIMPRIESSRTTQAISFIREGSTLDDIANII